MQFKTKKISNDVMMIYGFDNKIEFIMVMTLHKKKNETEIHGFLSRKSMSVCEFISLWKFLKSNVKTDYIVMDVLPEHSRAYKLVMDCVECKKTKSFDGLECERLKINIKSKLKPFQSV